MGAISSLAERELRNEKILRLRAEGQTYKQIAPLVNLTPTGVLYAIGNTRPRKRKFRQMPDHVSAAARAFLYAPAPRCIVLLVAGCWRVVGVAVQPTTKPRAAGNGRKKRRKNSPTKTAPLRSSCVSSRSSKVSQFVQSAAL